MCKLNQNLSRKLNRFKRKFKSYKCINYLIKVTRKFQSNIHIKYVSYTIIAFIIAFIFLYPSKEVILNNETAKLNTESISLIINIKLII